MKILNFYKKKYKVLYLFITHQTNYKKTLHNCISNYSDFLIVVGGQSSTYFDGSTLYLDVDDSYDGLPEKVYESMKKIVLNEKFKNYSHLCKLDSDMIIKKDFSQKILSKNDFFGFVQTVDGDRGWGKEKFSEKSKFRNYDYKGNYVPWCLGGYGYVVSFSAVKKIISENINFKNEPYEDLLIAKLLNHKGIYPNNFKKIREYIISPSHKYLQ